MLHGWRIADRKHMRMSGYPAKTRSVDWSHDGGWLATSGAEACIVWPFQTKDGPMGKAPRECGVRPAKVSRVACHPNALIIAIGYEDGWILPVSYTHLDVYKRQHSLRLMQCGLCGLSSLFVRLALFGEFAIDGGACRDLRG